MSPDMMELIVIVLCGILIISVVYEMAQRWMRHVEDKREQERVDLWRNKKMWEDE